jgi:hypothetical protein
MSGNARYLREAKKRAASKQPERRKELTISKVKYISSQSEIPAGQNYVLVVYGEKSLHTPHPTGLTITVASTASELAFLAAVHTAKQIARQAKISEVLVCDTVMREPRPGPDGMFIFVPPHEELSSNVVGLDVYNIRDIALDANGLSGYIVSVGAFLGMGDHHVVVHPTAISFKAGDDGWHATMNVNGDQLKSAPEYKYSGKS